MDQEMNSAAERQKPRPSSELTNNLRTLLRSSGWRFYQAPPRCGRIEVRYSTSHFSAKQIELTASLRISCDRRRCPPSKLHRLVNHFHLLFIHTTAVYRDFREGSLDLLKVCWRELNIDCSQFAICVWIL